LNGEIALHRNTWKKQFRASRRELKLSSYDFREKIKELEKIDKELKKIYAVEVKLGSSTALITSEIKLTNLRCQLIKELINYLNS
jgi:hypothetical protein